MPGRCLPKTHAADGGPSPACAGLRRADVILSANYQPVGSVEALEAIIAEAQDEDREAILLQVQRRGGAPVYRPVRLR